MLPGGASVSDMPLSYLRAFIFISHSHWFYEDFVREQNPKFPSLPLKRFSEMLFHACPLLHQWSHDHEQAFNTFMQYKTRVPVCGAIMLNESWEKVRYPSSRYGAWIEITLYSAFSSRAGSRPRDGVFQREK